MTESGESASSPNGPGGPDDEIIDAEVVVPPTTPGQFGGTPSIPDPDYTESGVPTFDFVRDKIENRIATAIGSQELAEGTPEGRQVDEMMRKRDEAAKKRLEEIRKSMGG
ncbi:PspA domain-containing protein [Gordonia sp. L191]|uniref:PspA domain-containing protein n=1 Tax=Gordonia sp. L191 TaxID=2982699 RepID=UPI0024BFCA89|nr:PspA domain-containing protein [Gordonia sp. L191]WHU49173.1 PspA domain-containing protein [Gordonia sp. L191]